MKILVTGGPGFIGLARVGQLITDLDQTVINIDKPTYAGNLEAPGPASRSPRHFFCQEDICNRRSLEQVFREHRSGRGGHLAAERHIDRSIDGEAYVRSMLAVLAGR